MNDAPLHCIDTVVWDSTNGGSVGQWVDNVVIPLTFTSLERKHVIIIKFVRSRQPCWHNISHVSLATLVYKNECKAQSNCIHD